MYFGICITHMFMVSDLGYETVPKDLGILVQEKDKDAILRKYHIARLGQRIDIVCSDNDGLIEMSNILLEKFGHLKEADEGDIQYLPPGFKEIRQKMKDVIAGALGVPIYTSGGGTFNYEMYLLDGDASTLRRNMLAYQLQR